MQPTRCHAAIALLAALGCASACQRTAGPPAVLERDSAGIRIVTTVGGDAAFPRWRLAAAPSLDAGREAAAGAFSRIRGVAVLSDGRIVVLDGGAGEVRWFLDSGEAERNAPVPGHTPGDDASLWLVGVLRGDTLLVWDEAQARFTRYDEHGVVIDTTTVRPSLPRFQPWLAFLDGLVLATWRADPVAPESGAVTIDSTRLVLADPRTGGHTTLRTTPGVSWWTAPGGLEMVPFTGNALFAIAGDDVLIAWGASWSIERWDRAGRLRARYDLDRPAARVTADEIARHRARVTRGPVDARDAAARLDALGRMPWPERRPPWDRLLVDDGGAIWARIEDSDPDAHRQWIVFGPAGDVIASLRTPVFLEIWQVTRDLVLGSGRDDAGREHVWGYRLDRRLP